MLLNRDTLEGIQAGRITLQFRRWQRPTVRTGGTLLTRLGQLAIEKVEPIELGRISAGDARKAGYDTLEELKSELESRTGQVYRIELGAISADPRIALRQEAPDAAATATILKKLARMDAAADRPWTRAALRLIEAHPGRRAGDLAQEFGMPRLPFKANIRKLKALGLTISLEVGYELSARGRLILQQLG